MQKRCAKLHKRISRRDFNLDLINPFYALRFESQRLHSGLLSSFVRDGVLRCWSVQEEWCFLSRYGLSSSSQPVLSTVPWVELARFLLQLPSEDDPIHDLVPFVRYWVQSQPECIHFSHITAEQVCREATSMLGKRCAGYDGVSITQLFDALPVLSHFLADIFNKSIADGKFPDCWKFTVIRPVPNVADPWLLSHLRPIAF